jgi:hypothetical protein
MARPAGPQLEPHSSLPWLCFYPEEFYADTIVRQAYCEILKFGFGFVTQTVSLRAP